MQIRMVTLQTSKQGWNVKKKSFITALISSPHTDPQSTGTYIYKVMSLLHKLSSNCESRTNQHIMFAFSLGAGPVQPVSPLLLESPHS